jgi:hypothetical protein
MLWLTVTTVFAFAASIFGRQCRLTTGLNMAEHFDWNTTAEWCGYCIKRTHECGGSQDMSKPVYVVTKGMCNPIPGAMFFSDPEQAKKGIAALELAKLLVPAPDYSDDSAQARRLRSQQGHAYHMLMKLALT